MLSVTWANLLQVALWAAVGCIVGLYGDWRAREVRLRGGDHRRGVPEGLTLIVAVVLLSICYGALAALGLH